MKIVRSRINNYLLKMQKFKHCENIHQWHKLIGCVGSLIQYRKRISLWTLTQLFLYTSLGCTMIHEIIRIQISLTRKGSMRETERNYLRVLICPLEKDLECVLATVLP